MAVISVISNARNKEIKALIKEKHWEKFWIVSWQKYPQERHNGEEKSDMWEYKYGEAM
jgi:hypothetical protein